MFGAGVGGSYSIGDGHLVEHHAPAPDIGGVGVALLALCVLPGFGVGKAELWFFVCFLFV